MDHHKNASLKKTLKEVVCTKMILSYVPARKIAKEDT
jgi:hypothetical protein